MVFTSLGSEPGGMNARIRAARGNGAGDMTRLGAQATAAARWLDERPLAVVSFRVRLLRMALRRRDHLPELVVIALEAPGYETDVLLDPDVRVPGIGSVS